MRDASAPVTTLDERKLNPVSEIGSDQRSIQWQLMRGTMTVPLGRYSYAYQSTHARTAVGDSGRRP
jgi:hypothetical protein